MRNLGGIFKKKKERDFKCMVYDNAMKHGKNQINFRNMIRGKK